jgi:pantothenate kinase
VRRISRDDRPNLEAQPSRLCSVPEDQRLLVGISGIPASGKSTLARRVVEIVNERLRAERGGDVEAVMVGLDGERRPLRCS